jgi:ABC-2 type transport system ATP-binding protein
MKSATPAIDVRGLRKTYRPRSASPVVALDSLSLTVPQGELFGLLGPNGAGKSTLVKVLSTLTLPTSGEAIVNGFDVVRDPLAVRRSIAVVIQDTSTETFLTVWDNLISYGLFQGLTIAESRRRAGFVVENFGLEPYLKEKCQDLSGGNKRRVQVAKTFLIERPVLFLDEATTGMDPVVRRRAIDLIRTQTKAGRTILLTTQVLSEAEELCDRIAIIDRGAVQAVGDVHSLKAMVREAYEATVTFESVTSELLESIERRGAVDLSRQANTLRFTIRAPEAEVLALLSEAARISPMVHFEVSGASLEDVFIEILKRPAAKMEGA